MASFSVEWDDAQREAAKAAVANGLQSFLTFDPVNPKKPVAVCLGTGRFMRGTMVPMLQQLEYQVVMAAPRSRDFVESMAERGDGSYEADVVGFDGAVATRSHSLAAVGALAVPEAKEEFARLPFLFPSFSLLVVGVTEAGLTPDAPAMNHVAELLHHCYLSDAERALSVWSSDDVPRNGELMKRLVVAAPYVQGLHSSEPFLAWVDARVCFHNSMLDRITSHRPGEPLVPLSEPMPLKAVVLEDLKQLIPEDEYPPNGFVVRRSRRELDRDLNLKLRIASATQLVMALALALRGDASLSAVGDVPQLAAFAGHLFTQDVMSVVIDLDVKAEEATRVFDEWMKRLAHRHLDQSTLFLAQNAVARAETQLIPSVRATVAQGGTPSGFMAASLAIALRFTTPWGRFDRDGGTVFVGHLPPGAARQGGAAEEYAPPLLVDWAQGTYEFQDGGDGAVAQMLAPLARQPSAAAAGATVAAVLSRMEGFDMGEAALSALCVRVAVMYDALVRGKPPLELVDDVLRAEAVALWLREDEVEEVVRAEVASASAVDVLTHLLPPEHGELMRWGVDALLTEPELASEFLALGREAPAAFFAMEPREQADRVWHDLFVRRSPLSDATLGVVEALSGLGLGSLVAQRDLAGIRHWYSQQRPEAFVRKTLEAAGVRYAIMTNSPFDSAQALNWRAGKPVPPQLRAALCVDELFAGNWPAISAALLDGEYEESLTGLHQYLRDWLGCLEPEFITAEVPPSFRYPAEYEMEEVPSAADLLDDVLLPLAQQTRLPIALRFGLERRANPPMGEAGHAALAFCDSSPLRQLLLLNPDIKFVVSFRTQVNQPELCALAAAFPNLHLHGVPGGADAQAAAIAARVEALGTSFTAAHSDARVLEHLPARWRRARRVLAGVLADRYKALAAAGWQLSRDDVRRDVQRLMGGSFETFVHQ